MDRKTAKLIRAFCKLTNKSYRGMKKEFSKMADKEKSASRKELKKFYDQNRESGMLTSKYSDLKLPMKDFLKGKNIKTDE